MPSPRAEGSDEQQPQPRDLGRVLRQEDRAEALAVAFGDPAALILGIEIVEEVGDDLRAQPLEILGPSVFLRVEHGVARDDPAEVAGARLAQDETGLRLGLRRQQRLDRAQRRHQPVLLVRAEPFQHGADLRPRMRFQRRERLAAARRHRQERLPRVVGRHLLADQSVFMETRSIRLR